MITITWTKNELKTNGEKSRKIDKAFSITLHFKLMCLCMLFSNIISACKQNEQERTRKNTAMIFLVPVPKQTKQV